MTNSLKSLIKRKNHLDFKHLFIKQIVPKKVSKLKKVLKLKKYDISLYDISLYTCEIIKAIISYVGYIFEINLWLYYVFCFNKF